MPKHIQLDVNESGFRGYPSHSNLIGTGLSNINWVWDGLGNRVDTRNEFRSSMGIHLWLATTQTRLYIW